MVHKESLSNFALKPLIDFLKLRADPINYLAPPLKQCLKFLAPAVKKIEFLLIRHVVPVYLSSHGEISPL